MIAYFDTSAIVPLLVTESSSLVCARLWDEADAVVTVRIAFAETAAALAQAERMRRITSPQHDAASVLLAQKWQQLQIVEIDQALMYRAAVLARSRGLRGYDATHCAAAERINDGDVVAVGGDGKLLSAWQALPMATVDINTEGTASG